MASFLSCRFRRGSSDGGFTVLESVFAISILAVGILAVASLQGSAIRSNGSAVILADATARISSQLEALTMLPFTDPELGEGEHKPGSDPYGITWDVTLSGDTKTIKIWAEWEDRGVPKRLSLSHILSNNRS